MKILWMVSPQVDYGPGGAMELPGVSEIWASWLELAPQYDELWLSLEMHPANHISFAAMHPWRKPGQRITFQGKELKLEITHCVGGSFGALLSSEFQELKFAKTFHFGTPQMEEATLFLSNDEAEKFSLSKAKEIHLVGVNHLPLFEATVANLNSFNLKTKWLKSKSLSPE